MTLTRAWGQKVPADGQYLVSPMFEDGCSDGGYGAPCARLDEVIELALG